jgi:hypothetical protein
MEDGIEQSMSMLIQEAEHKKQMVQKPPDKTSQQAAAFQQVHPVGLSLPTDRNASSYPPTDRNASSYPLKDTIPPRDTTPLTNTNSGS